MNRLFCFATGSLSTLTVSNFLVLSGYKDVILTQLVSLAGGILSTVIIAWLEHRREKERK